MITPDGESGIYQKRRWKINAQFTQDHYIVFHEDESDDSKKEELIENEEVEDTNKLNLQWDNDDQNKEIITSPTYFINAVYINVKETESSFLENFELTVSMYTAEDSFWQFLQDWWFLIIAVIVIFVVCFWNWYKHKPEDAVKWKNYKHEAIPNKK